MYLGKNHISLLSTFMTGYMFALQCNGFDINSDPYFAEGDQGFFGWFQKKRNYSPSPSWYHTILRECDGSEEKALELFLTLLEEYRSQLKINAL
jgi:hypothetical protein